MAFVNEEIPENEKALFSDASIFFNPESRSWPIKLTRWVIDRGLNICMIHIGGGAMPTFTADNGFTPVVMALCWGKEIVKFEVKYKLDGDGRLGSPPSNLYVNVQKVMLPTSLKGQETEVFQIIKEAIEAAGDRTFANDYKAVIVTTQNIVVYSETMQEDIYGLHV
jgi:hypothetical protein